MAKPDGHARPCGAAGVRLLHGCWRDVIGWLQGADPDDLEHTGVVAAVAQKAAVRMPRYSAYDIATWTAQARDVLVTVPEHPEPAPLITVAGSILTGIGFASAGQHTGWLNRVTIELLYREANRFTANRELLIPALLKGPVSIAYLEGTRVALAHALKLTIRSALAATTSPLTNLIHLAPVTEREWHLITASLEPGPGSRQRWATASAPWSMSGSPSTRKERS
jgi:hypothetical protein